MMLCADTCRHKRTKTLGFIGFGAFGSFAAQHLVPHFQVVFHDPKILELPAPMNFWAQAASLEEVAACDIVVLAMPVQQLSNVVSAISPLVKPGALILDVCSVKSAPLEILSSLPGHVDILGTHPLFGPQSGRRGLTGLPIALVPLRGHQTRSVKRFLERVLGLSVFVTTAENHDRQMAYVQGLTHLIARVVLAMPIPEISLKTSTFQHLEAVIDLLRHDSDELFAAICGENPYMDDMANTFFQAIEDVSVRLGIATGTKTPSKRGRHHLIQMASSP
jgi:prephenate dehydrogenase